MNDNGRFKKKKVYFSQVSNNVLRDSNLSLKAKGLYSLIQSYITIENFILYKATLKKQCKEGNKAFESSWIELKTKGYLVQEKHRDESGNYYYIYELLDIIHTPKKEVVDKGGGGKGGSFNKTDLNNTDLNNTDIYYAILPDGDQCVPLPTEDHRFLKIYDDQLVWFFKKHHKRINQKDIDTLMEWVRKLEDNGVDESEWTENVEDHLASLPPNNDGGILAFMAASYRYFTQLSPQQEAEF